jgi:hypothetical protein
MVRSSHRALSSNQLLPGENGLLEEACTRMELPGTTVCIVSFVRGASFLCRGLGQLHKYEKECERSDSGEYFAVAVAVASAVASVLVL